MPCNQKAEFWMLNLVVYITICTLVKVNYFSQACKLNPVWRHWKVKLPLQFLSEEFKTAAPRGGGTSRRIQTAKNSLGCYLHQSTTASPHILIRHECFQTPFNAVVNFWVCIASEMDEWAWSTGGIILTAVHRSTHTLNLSQCHLVHHKLHIGRPGIETGLPRWESDAKQAEWQHSASRQCTASGGFL